MVIRAVLELVATSPGLTVDGGDADPGRQRWEIGGPVTIGRSDAADLTLAVPSLSRFHLELLDLSGRLAARDLASRNGSTINGEPLGDEPRVLSDDDEIVLGGAIALRFIDPMATPIGNRIGRLHGIWIDPDTDAVWLDAKLVEPPLSPRQLDLLRLLDDAAGAIVPRERIVEVVWADVAAEGVTDQALAALIKRLRQRLGRRADGSDVVEIVRNRGLRLRRES